MRSTICVALLGSVLGGCLPEGGAAPTPDANAPGAADGAISDGASVDSTVPVCAAPDGVVLSAPSDLSGGTEDWVDLFWPLTSGSVSFSAGLAGPELIDLAQVYAAVSGSTIYGCDGCVVQRFPDPDPLETFLARQGTITVSAFEGPTASVDGSITLTWTALELVQVVLADDGSFVVPPAPCTRRIEARTAPLVAPLKLGAG